ncbi:2-amino-4-hydroxy-6-hydroxymethyldihydropteridine diphosphokinase [Glaciecola siphonariae]|uniref:2-amino-4-hydroxy-6-hydroxymethyldihydropteridine diphosphokinase n=1 Tax=Glaciecola siphonariae TaxID=521012 RepID=A0ABV9LV77_9ALTE
MNSTQQTRHCILVSLGSNINKEENTALGLNQMFRCFGELSLSKVYESQSVGFSGDNFYNLVAMAHTTLGVDEVCLALKDIEQNCGRQRQAEKFSPRTLDLDLLTFDDKVCETPIILPRPEIEYNAFVLQPMADIVPDHIHPVTKKSYAQMWQDYDKTSQRLWPVEYAWSAP